LLHGITGSGKTEVYLRAIAEVTSRGQAAVVLVPEISLTPQLGARFRARFGDRVAVLHSGLTARERYDEWHRLRCGEADIALGARSAVFAPLSRPLGIVVVDEEHDSSFKQEEGVRYNARDVALVRAKQAGAVCVLGSATPSLESYRGAETGRLELLELRQRATAGELPAVKLLDLRRYQPDADSMMTAPLAEAVSETLAAGDQAILFLNRRGWSTFVLCTACGEAQRCDNCAVSLTYHRWAARMLCHYCSSSRPLPRACPSCGAAEAIAQRGLGTERAADAIAERFPSARIGRLDRDVAGGAGAEAILARFARRELDILVGTQMVTKGHDFPGVTLVGVLCADTGLSMPDFRAAERTFQLLSQVAGRAGRGDKPGRVLIQSYRTEHTAIIAARDHDYPSFYRSELASRAELGYPPHGHLVAIRVDGRDAAAVEQRTRRIAAAARPVADQLGVAVLGPTEAPLARLKGRTRWHLWLRAPERSGLRGVLRALDAELGSRAGGVRVTADVDPVSAL
jgi:primosomal protein N' (replication factor Y)